MSDQPYAPRRASGDVRAMIAGVVSLGAPAGAQAGWAFDKGPGLRLDARDLFKKAHVSNTGVRPVALATDALYNSVEGRAVFVGLGFKW
ncbi:MAG: hypothetical protein IPK81_05210 [Rhodospirillales bacterium]|nr:MAG: hypothetical protein IPK81_05210 [Rhodospirillales bacterium]